MRSREVERVSRLIADLTGKAETGTRMPAGVPPTALQIRIVDEGDTPEAQGRIAVLLYDARDTDVDESLSGGDPCALRVMVPRHAVKALRAGRSRFCSREDFERYLQEVLDQAAFDRVVSLVGARERSVADVVGRLVREGFEGPCAERAALRACRCSLLDDERFARQLVASKVRSGWGRRRIEQELARQGVALDVADLAPEGAFTPDEEIERALAALNKRGVRGTSPFQKSIRFLLGRGFPTDVAYKAAKRHFEALDLCVETMD